MKFYIHIFSICAWHANLSPTFYLIESYSHLICFSPHKQTLRNPQINMDTKCHVGDQNESISRRTQTNILYWMCSNTQLLKDVQDTKFLLYSFYKLPWFYNLSWKAPKIHKHLLENDFWKLRPSIWPILFTKESSDPQQRHIFLLI